MSSLRRAFLCALQAVALLEEGALTEACEARPAAHGSEAPCHWPSTLTDSGGIAEAKPTVWLNGVLTGERGTVVHSEPAPHPSQDVPLK